MEAKSILVSGDVRTTEGPCWIWPTIDPSNGYGRFDARRPLKRKHYAHRSAYETLIGPMPKGLVTDHLCRNRACCNPWHLEPVTHAENVRRGLCGVVNGARIRAKTHCPQGHPYDEVNTILRPNGWRACRTCRNSQQTERRRILAASRPEPAPREISAEGRRRMSEMSRMAWTQVDAEERFRRASVRAVARWSTLDAEARTKATAAAIIARLAKMKERRSQFLLAAT